MYAEDQFCCQRPDVRVCYAGNPLTKSVIGYYKSRDLVTARRGIIKMEHFSWRQCASFVSPPSPVL